MAAVYMTCGNRDAVLTLFCGYCSTLEKVMETANIIKFVVGLDPSFGCRICEHITNIVNSDPDITEYRGTFDDGPDNSDDDQEIITEYRQTFNDDPDNSDNDPEIITEYRQTLSGIDRVDQLYRTSMSGTGNWHTIGLWQVTRLPLPSLHVTDIYLDMFSDRDTMQGWQGTWCIATSAPLCQCICGVHTIQYARWFSSYESVPNCQHYI